MKRRRLVWISGAAAGAVLAMFLLRAAFRRDGADPSQAVRAPVRRGPLSITLLQKGLFVPEQEILVSPSIQSELTIAEIVAQGTPVKRGDLLVRFEDKQGREQMTQLEEEVQTAQKQIGTAQAELDIQGLVNADDLDKAELDLERYRMALEKHEKLEGPMEIKKAETELEIAQAAFEETEQNLEELKQMLEQDLVSSYEVRQSRRETQLKRFEKESAELKLRLVREYDFPQMLKRHRSDLERADRFLERIRLVNTSQLSKKETALQEAQTQWANKRKRLDQLREELGRYTQLAPSDGVVFYSKGHNPWHPIPPATFQPGGRIYGAETIMTLPNLNAMKLMLQVSEGDIQSIAEGMPISGYPIAFPERTFTGKIAKVGMAAEKGGGFFAQEGNLFHVECLLDRQPEGLRPSMEAQVEIHVQEIPDCLQVPLETIFHDEEGPFCFVHTGGAPPFHRRRVQTGRSNRREVEIRSGLSEGETVALEDLSDRIP
jgi:HlyD family secretion protein